MRAHRSWQHFAPELEWHFNPRLSIANPEEQLEARRQASAEARQRMRGDCDLRYGPGPRQTLDLFQPERAGPCSLVFVHGGYWRGGDKSNCSFVAEPFVARGIPTFVINYDLCPTVSLWCLVEETHEALAWISACAVERGYADRLFLFGHSAGAHLVAMTLANPSPRITIAGAALATGIYDVEPVLHLGLNSEIGLTPGDVAALSPLTLPPPRGIPLVLSIAGLEPAGWRGQTLGYVEHCRLAGTEVELFDYLHQDHMSLLQRHLEEDCPMRERMLTIMQGRPSKL